MEEKENNKKTPLQVKSIPDDEIDKKEMETIYRELSKKYCICKHKKEKHYKEEYQCEYKATRFFDGHMEEFVCQCSLYESLESAAEFLSQQPLKENY